jgi:hypothetical protein
MSTDPVNPLTVKEFRFYPESKIVTLVYEDDKADDFSGEENFQRAWEVGSASATSPATYLELKNDEGSPVTVRVPKGTPHETFEA